jgi:hypothetical protein
MEIIARAKQPVSSVGRSIKHPISSRVSGKIRHVVQGDMGRNTRTKIRVRRADSHSLENFARRKILPRGIFPLKRRQSEPRLIRHSQVARWCFDHT